MSNPLLINAGLPRFGEITHNHVAGAVDHLVEIVTRKVTQIEKNTNLTFVALYEPLEEIDVYFQKIWGPIEHLQMVANSSALREAYEKELPRVIELELRVKQNEIIYRKLFALGECRDLLNPVQRRIVELRLRDADLAGISLTEEKRQRFNTILEELSRLSTQFANNNLDAVKEFKLVLKTKKEIAGLPQGFLRLVAQNYNEVFLGKEATTKQGPWLITLDHPSYIPFMEYSECRDLREKVYRAHVTSASREPLDNTMLITKILRLRKEMANMLGFSNYADLSLSTKMAGNTTNVKKLLQELQEACFPLGKEEHEALIDYARNHGHGELMNWDILFWGHKLKEELFNLDEEKMRRYFPLPVVLQGMFTLVKKLFAIEIRDCTSEVQVWHPDVTFYKVYDERGKHLAAFYLDPYSRPQSKMGGAWMNKCVSRREVYGMVDVPACYVACNFTPPVGDEPSSLVFYEVLTIFHEFGHALHNMLTRINYADVSGGNGVEWDAIELPSLFMENFCYLKSVIKDISRHVDSGETLPATLLTQLRASKNFRVASGLLRQLFLSQTDLQLHETFDPNGDDNPFALMHRVAEQTQIILPISGDRFLCSFSHIFAGGYAAGYYSYKWAEVLSADAFSLFQENGLDDTELRKTGQQYRDTILALGGSIHPAELFRKFRGRDPSTAALLRDYGVNNSVTET